MADRRDYYDTLGVGRTSSQEEIRRSFRRLARRYHPDVNPNDSESEARFKEIAEAYEVLRDPERRAMYDQFGHAAPTGAMVGDFWDDLGGFGNLFEAFFGGRGAGTRPQMRRGADLRYDLIITLEEVASGVEKSIEAKRVRRCAECEGTGSQSKSGGEKCGKCGGAGQVRQTRATPIGQFTTVGACPADRRGGSGAVPLANWPAGARPRHGQAPLGVAVAPHRQRLAGKRPVRRAEHHRGPVVVLRGG